MKRHFPLLVFRAVLAAGVAFALPFSHMQWGEPYPGGDGQKHFGWIIMFGAYGTIAALIFVALGSIVQFFLRARSARLTVLADFILFLLFGGVLTYAGITLRFVDTQPPQGAAFECFISAG